MENPIYRYAAVDVGSNAVRLLLSNVVEEHNEIHYKKSELIRIPLRLGEDVFKSGKISSAKTKRFIKTMQAFSLLIDVFDPIKYRACATASLREAVNGFEIITMIRKESGLKLEIISGKEEAELIYSNHTEQYLDKNQSYLYIDVGGGSTELTLFDKGSIIASNSFKIGTLRWLAGNVDKLHWEEMKTWVRENAAGHAPLTAIGSGGNINKILKLLERKSNLLTFAKIKEFYDAIKIHTVEERMEIWELNPDRADVIVPATKIYLAVMKAANIVEINVPQIGLADGIVHYLHENNQKLIER